MVAAIDERGEWDDTLVVVTADHGEQLGDHGLIEKIGFFPQSYHIIGIWRDPRAKGPASIRDSRRTSICCPRSPTRSASNSPSKVTASRSRRCFRRSAPWREWAHYEWDSRLHAAGRRRGAVTRETLARRNLAVSVGDDLAFVQFGDGSMKCFDLAVDPTWRTECTDLERVFSRPKSSFSGVRRTCATISRTCCSRPDRRGRWPSGDRIEALAKTVS